MNGPCSQPIHLEVTCLAIVLSQRSIVGVFHCFTCHGQTHKRAMFCCSWPHMVGLVQRWCLIEAAIGSLDQLTCPNIFSIDCVHTFDIYLLACKSCQFIHHFHSPVLLSVSTHARTHAPHTRAQHLVWCLKTIYSKYLWKLIPFSHIIKTEHVWNCVALESIR